MPRSSLMSLVSALTVATLTASAIAAHPSESLLPATTKGFIVVPNLEEFRAKWNETQLGQLAKDPVMRPFAEDLRAQIKDKLAQTGVRLGLTLEDLQGVHGGEVCLAVIQPGGDKTQHAMAILADVTGHVAELASLKEKISRQMTERGATRAARMIRGVNVTEYTVPLKNRELPPLKIYQFLVDNQYVAVDHLGEAEAILARLAGERDTTLAESPAFRVSMQRCERDAGNSAVHVRWFVEPFGYAETVRAAAGGKRKRGTDTLAVLANQGFSAIRGLAGHIAFADGEHEIVYRTFIYAPPAAAADPNGSKFEKAARMLDFPPGGGLIAQSWVSRNTVSYTSFNWKMKEAFEYSKSLVDELAGEEGVFEEVLRGIKLDPKGPKVDLRKELVAHLGERATVLTDNVLPVSPQSQRVMVAIELTNPTAVARTLDKTMESDPNAEKREFNGHIIWEMVEAETGDLAISIDAPPGLGPFGDGPAAEKQEERAIIPHSAVTVANGHLIFATHINFIRDLLQEPQDRQTLAEAADYAVVNRALDKLGGGDDSFRLFVRCDEAYLPGYELLRQGKMAEAETLLGRLLNSVLAPEEEDTPRQQQIDGSKLPDFQVVRRYLGPAGLYVKSEANGWYAAGCLLSKDAE